MLIVLVFGLSFFLASTAAAGEPQSLLTARIEVDKEVVTIGEKIKYTITVTTEKDTEVELSNFGNKLGDFTVSNSGSQAKVFWGRKKIIAWYILDTFQLGKVSTPKVMIKYREKSSQDWSQIETKEKEIEVKSLLEKSGAGAVLRDIKGPIPVASGFNLLWLILPVIFIAGFAILRVFSRKRKIKQSSPPKKAAHEIAYEQLEALKQRDLIRQGKIKGYFIELSDIIRHYLENRFNLRAPEMTTEEFLAHVRDYAQLEKEHKVLLREFLSACDLVKFAKYAPSGQEIDSAFSSAKIFIDQTKKEQL